MSMLERTGYSVAESAEEVRVEFLRRTYLHLAGAVLAFVALSALFQAAGLGQFLAYTLFGSRLGWIAFIGGFALVGWMATALSHSEAGKGMQYAGLGLYTLAQAVIFSPLLFLAARVENAIATAGGITVIVFCGLSVYVLVSRADFSFLRMALTVGGFVALGAIVLGAVFGFSLGLWFSVAMVVFAMGAILYSTSNALHHYRADQYVAAALELFAAVALLFWYVLRLVLSLGRR